MIQDIDYIVAKVLSQEATDSEILIFERWLKEDENNYKSFLKMKAYWNSYSNSKYIKETSIIPNYSLLAQKIVREKAKRLRKKRAYITTAISSIAACIFIVLIYTLGDSNQNTATTFCEFSTTAHIDTIILPDQSKVILNKNSNLLYSDSFNKKDRTIILKGEALFDVTKNEELPFIVKTEAESEIVVLGTMFNVNSYTEQDCIDVTLFRGSIRFQTQQDQVTLSPNQELTFNKNNSLFEIKESNSDLTLLWLQGVYKYKSISLNELMEVLSKVYDTEISITSSKLSNTNISGAFYNDQSLDEILKIISRSLPIKWTKHKNSIIISPNF